MNTPDISDWLRVHALSLNDIEGQAERELLLILDTAQPRLSEAPAPGRQGTTRPVALVLGQSAAAILLRLLLSAGVQPAPAETGASPRH